MLIIFDNSMQLLGTGGQFEAQVCNSKKVMTNGRSGLKISAVRSSVHCSQNLLSMETKKGMGKTKQRVVFFLRESDS